MSGLKKLTWMLSGALALALILLGVSIGANLSVVLPALQPPSAGAQSSVTLSALEESFVNLYDGVNPAVVSIQVIEENGFGQGSGFVVDKQGYIATNNHVVGDAVEISVIFSDGTFAEAELVGTDPDTDLAVIKVDPADAPDLVALPIGDSSALLVGQIVIAIGNPFGLDGTMTMGIVSALERSMPTQAAVDGGRFNTPDIIQTDAAINPGNSGGPLLNLAGEVVGVNTYIRTDTGVNSGVGFAIPSSIIGRVIPALIDSGDYQHTWLGISGRTIDSLTAELMGFGPEQSGVLVATISDESPALRAALQGSDDIIGYEDGEFIDLETLDAENADTVPTIRYGGDVIVSADDVAVVEFNDLVEFLAERTTVGQTITLGILRDGQLIEVDVTLAARPE